MIDCEIEKVMIEVCCGSFEDCLAAADGGADRIELNSALSLGGLTPDFSALTRAKSAVDVPIICMCRPRAGGFHYSNSEIEGMFLDAGFMLEHGADGIAFGFLHEDGTIRYSATKKMVDLIHSYGKTAVYHRAFDVTPDPIEAICTLIECGVDRVLTSGQGETIMDGLPLITALRKHFGTSIEILPGCGVNADNANEILKTSGVKGLHSSCKNYFSDSTTARGAVSFACLEEPHDLAYPGVDMELVKKLVTAVNQ